jgi:hypothetical protein
MANFDDTPSSSHGISEYKSSPVGEAAMALASREAETALQLIMSTPAAFDIPLLQSYLTWMEKRIGLSIASSSSSSSLSGIPPLLPSLPITTEVSTIPSVGGVVHPELFTFHDLWNNLGSEMMDQLLPVDRHVPARTRYSTFTNADEYLLASGVLQCRLKYMTNHGMKNCIDWATIALRFLPGRTPSQLSRRWATMLRRPVCRDAHLKQLMDIYRTTYMPLTHAAAKAVVEKAMIEEALSAKKSSNTDDENSGDNSNHPNDKRQGKRGGYRIPLERLNRTDLQRLADLVTREGPQWGAISRSTQTIFMGRKPDFLRSEYIRWQKMQSMTQAQLDAMERRHQRQHERRAQAAQMKKIRNESEDVIVSTVTAEMLKFRPSLNIRRSNQITPMSSRRKKNGESKGSDDGSLYAQQAQEEHSTMMTTAAASQQLQMGLDESDDLLYEELLDEEEEPLDDDQHQRYNSSEEVVGVGMAPMPTEIGGMDDDFEHEVLLGEDDEATPRRPSNGMTTPRDRTRRNINALPTSSVTNNNVHGMATPQSSPSLLLSVPLPTSSATPSPISAASTAAAIASTAALFNVNNINTIKDFGTPAPSAARSSSPSPWVTPLTYASLLTTPLASSSTPLASSSPSSPSSSMTRSLGNESVMMTPLPLRQRQPPTILPAAVILAATNAAIAVARQTAQQQEREHKNEQIEQVAMASSSVSLSLSSDTSSVAPLTSSLISYSATTSSTITTDTTSMQLAAAAATTTASIGTDDGDTIPNVIVESDDDEEDHDNNNNKPNTDNGSNDSDDISSKSDDSKRSAVVAPSIQSDSNVTVQTTPSTSIPAVAAATMIALSTDNQMTTEKSAPVSTTVSSTIKDVNVDKPTKESSLVSLSSSPSRRAANKEKDAKPNSEDDEPKKQRQRSCKNDIPESRRWYCECGQWYHSRSLPSIRRHRATCSGLPPPPPIQPPLTKSSRGRNDGDDNKEDDSIPSSNETTEANIQRAIQSVANALPSIRSKRYRSGIVKRQEAAEARAKSKKPISATTPPPTIVTSTESDAPTSTSVSDTIQLPLSGASADSTGHKRRRDSGDDATAVADNNNDRINTSTTTSGRTNKVVYGPVLPPPSSTVNITAIVPSIEQPPPVGPQRRGRGRPPKPRLVSDVPGGQDDSSPIKTNTNGRALTQAEMETWLELTYPSREKRQKVNNIVAATLSNMTSTINQTDSMPLNGHGTPPPSPPVVKEGQSVTIVPVVSSVLPPTTEASATKIKKVKKNTSKKSSHPPSPIPRVDETEEEERRERIKQKALAQIRRMEQESRRHGRPMRSLGDTGLDHDDTDTHVIPQVIPISYDIYHRIPPVPMSIPAAPIAITPEESDAQLAAEDADTMALAQAAEAEMEHTSTTVDLTVDDDTLHHSDESKTEASTTNAAMPTKPHIWSSSDDEWLLTTARNHGLDNSTWPPLPSPSSPEDHRSIDDWFARLIALLSEFASARGDTLQ